MALFSWDKRYPKGTVGVLELKYEGKLGDSLSGFYDASEDNQILFTTYFEPA